jgi:glucokinase
LNLERLLSVAMENPGTFTRAELVRATSLSPPTVGTLAGELLRQGLLTDLGQGPSRGGRRPSVMEFNADHGFVVGIALGATHTQIAVADLRGKPLRTHVWPTHPRSAPQHLLSRLANGVRRTLKEARVPLESVVAVAAGAPGAVDRDTGTVIALAANLAGWNDVPMAAMLARALKTPVFIENDVNLAILGEHWRGAAQGHNTCAFIHLDVGIGAGILIRGELYHGHHFLAGEIALMCMGPQYVGRDFGSRGCLETLAGIRSLLSRWRGARSGGPEREIGSLLRAAERGEPKAVRIVREMTTLVGIATTNLCLTIDPSLVVLGGPLVEGNDTVVARIRNLVGRIIPSPPDIVPSRLGKDASLWGSLLVATSEARELLRRGLGQSRVGAGNGAFRRGALPREETDVARGGAGVRETPPSAPRRSRA